MNKQDISKKIGTITNSLSTLVDTIYQATDTIDGALDIIDDLNNELVDLKKQLDPPGKLFKDMVVGEKGIIVPDNENPIDSLFFAGHVVTRSIDRVTSVDTGAFWADLDSCKLRVEPCEQVTIN